MKQSTSIILTLLVFSCFSNCLSQTKVFSPAELREDFEIFRESIEEMHPGIYWYTSKEEMDKSFGEVEQNLDNGLTELEFFRKLAPIISKIRCSHTWISPSKKTSTSLKENSSFFPLDLKIIDQKVYCINNNSSNKEIKPGIEILKINSFSADSLVTIFHVNNTGDGFIKTWKNFIFGKYFGYFYTFFIAQPDTYELEFLDLNGNFQQTTINAEKIEVIKERKKILIQPTKNIDLNFLDKKIALLDIKDFNPWKEGRKKKNFKKVLDQSFNSIDSANVENLIIDLRGNTGGYEKYGLRLLAYLKEETFVGYEHIRFKNTTFKYRKYSNTGSVLYLIFKALLNHDQVNDTTFLLKNDRNLKPVQPISPTYKGNIYVLIDGGSISTTSDFSSLFQHYDLGTLVGEETGGGSLGNSGNYSFTLTLPNTKIQYELPIAQYILNVEATKEKHGRGVIPEHPIDMNISDFINHVDTQLNYILNLIRAEEK